MVRAGRRPSCGGLLTTGGRPHPLATDRRTNASCRVQRPPMTPDAPNGCRRMVRGHVMPDCEASIACRAGAGDPGHHRPSISSICRRTISVRTSAGTGRSTVKRIVPFHRPYPRATVSRSRRSSTGLSERLAGRVDGHLATFATSRPDAWQRSTATQRLHAIPPDPPNVTAPARPTLPCPGTHGAPARVTTSACGDGEPSTPWKARVRTACCTCLSSRTERPCGRWSMR